LRRKIRLYRSPLKWSQEYISSNQAIIFFH
jgi:hypothetical protein